MSVNVTIQENGVGYDLALDALRVPVFGGGNVDVVPDGSRGLIKLTVYGNGTYKASEFLINGVKAYGISEIKVKCKQNIDNPDWANVTKEIKGDIQPYIKEGGRSRAFSAKRIITPLTAGGECQWILKNDVAVGEKTVNVDNKTYRAADDGLYGYSQVTVSGITITKTIDPSGNEVITHEDGDGTVTEVVPSLISVTKRPDRLGYRIGDTIDYTGIVVHAYAADGTDMGEIPFNELIFPEDKVRSIYYSDGNGINAKTIYYTPHWNRQVWVVGIPGKPVGTVDQELIYSCSEILGSKDGRPATYMGTSPGTLLATRYNGSNYLACLTGTNKADLAVYYTAEREAQVIKYGWMFAGGSSGVIQNKKFSGAGFRDSITDLPVSTRNPLDVSTDTLSPSSIMAVPVQWERPGDNELLKTSFDINIAT